MNVWIEKIPASGRAGRQEEEYSLGKGLWSPTKSRSGGDIYKNMREPKKGDLVLHLVDNSRISGASMVQEPYEEREINLGTDWDGTCYFIRLEGYEEFKRPIMRDEIFTEENEELLFDIADKSEVFYTRNQELRQGAYLTPCIPDLQYLLNSIHKKLNGGGIPHMAHNGAGTDGNNNAQQLSKNMILYGPPGTGKTYNTINYAVALIEKKPADKISKEEHSKVIERYNKYKQKGQIAFTTFHQSYGYEEFIEGIKPVMSEDDENNADVRYEIKAGIFKAFCDRAQSPIFEKVNKYGIRANPVVWKISLKGAGNNNVKEDCFVNNRIRIGWDEYGKDITEQTLFNYGGKDILNRFINQIVVGDIVFTLYDERTIDAIGVVSGDYEWLDSFADYKRSRSIKWITKDEKIDVFDLNGGHVLTQGSVYRLNRIQLSDVITILMTLGISIDREFKENEEPHVFIIDEINRGNISKIFGELITLIESTKRLGSAEAMTVTLPYSSKPFGVPQNVYIVGTMNTADRSIALLDTALRRRFDFIEMMPETKLLTGVFVEGIDIRKMLEIMNLRIEYLFDREHTIGHSYFLPLINNKTIDMLSDIFKNSIIPLLQEYFYEDYSKIQLVLGDNGKKNNKYKFIVDEALKVKDVFKGKADIDIPERRYIIQENAFDHFESYLQIYE